MLIALHKNARTTPAVRAEIAAQRRDSQYPGPALWHHRADGLQVEEALRLWGSLAHGPSSADRAHACARDRGGAPAAYLAVAPG